MINTHSIESFLQIKAFLKCAQNKNNSDVKRAVFRSFEMFNLHKMYVYFSFLLLFETSKQNEIAVPNPSSTLLLVLQYHRSPLGGALAPSLTARIARVDLRSTAIIHQLEPVRLPYTRIQISPSPYVRPRSLK